MDEVGSGGETAASEAAEAPLSASRMEILSVKELRLDIRIVLGRLRNMGPSRERSLAVTKLQEAGMWLGMDLRRLSDGVSCYTHGDDPTNARVDPADPGAPV